MEINNMKYTTSKTKKVTLKIVDYYGNPTVIAVDEFGKELDSPYICSFTEDGIKLYSGFEEDVRIKRRYGSTEVNVFDSVSGRNLDII